MRRIPRERDPALHESRSDLPVKPELALPHRLEVFPRAHAGEEADRGSFHSTVEGELLIRAEGKDEPPEALVYPNRDCQALASR